MNTTKVNLCKCNNCNTILVDENPRTDAKLYLLQQGKDGIWRTHLNEPVLDGEMIEEDGERFFGCGECQTDGYLTDL